MNTELFFALLIGVQSTLHCVGMCGPLALAAPINRKNKRSALWGTLSYNIGRITTYTYLGFLFGLLGIGNIWINGIQVLSVLTGLLFLSTAIYGSIETWPFLNKISFWIARQNTKLFAPIKQAPAMSRPFLFGIVNGLLPCGMVYLALIYAISLQSSIEASLSMFIFGLGTLPVMFFIPLIGQDRLYSLLPKGSQQILLFTIGLLLVLRGLGLGIPFISPAIKAPKAPHLQPSIECCEIQA